MTDGHCFISYSTIDGLDFARKLVNKLEGNNIPVWFDKDDLKPSMDWDIQIDHALKTCKMVLFVMTADSIHEKSVCRQEWSRALSFKKPIVPLWVQSDIDVPFRLQDRQRIDFSKSFDAGLAKLRDYLSWIDSPEGILQGYKDRLLDAERDLQRTRDEDRPRIKAEIEELTKLIAAQQKIVDNPKAAEELTQKNIEAGLERERKPEKLITTKTEIKFINPPPGIAPTYFQDREVENKEIVKFLKYDSLRLMTIVGRGGVGKTAMVCRLLKGLEVGELPDGLGPMKADGIVYLSETGSHRVNFANIFYDLCKLLPNPAAQELDAVYKNPQSSTEGKIQTLLEKFGNGRVVLLLDNFEPVVDTETFAIGDGELDEALRAFLNGVHTTLKIIITTRTPPKPLNLIQPGRQRVLTLDEGLESPYAENILREMDTDGRLGLKSASDDLLNRARERTRGYPRALEAMFAILASDRYTTLEELLSKPTPENVVQELVGEAFNRLDANAQKVMQALAVYNRPVTSAAVDYLLAPNLPAVNSAPILQRLANMHFARKESGKFYLHPVDRQFAFELIPFEDLTTNFTKLRQMDAEEKKENGLVIPPLNLPSSPISFDSRLKSAWRFNKYIKHDLTLRAADYFAQARKPRAEWKKLDDLAAQLAEFDLRCAAGDYDTAASISTDIDFNYLLLWGHYHLMIEMHKKTQEKITDPRLRAYSLNSIGLAYNSIGKIHQSIQCYQTAIEITIQLKDRAIESVLLGNLGNAYRHLGNARKAIEYLEQALTINREIGDRRGESVSLDNLGNAYHNLGDIHKAIEYHEQALTIDREIGDRRGESADLGNLALAYADLGDAHKSKEYSEQSLIIKQEISDRQGEAIRYENIGHALLSLYETQKAKESYQNAIQIADEISLFLVQLNARWGLAQAHLFQNDLLNAYATIEAALQYDVPENNHYATTLHGIITLRQGDQNAALQSFARAMAQADEILAKTQDYYEALDAKGLALCGLAVCDDKKYVDDAIKTFRAARKIARHAGIVKRNLRLFDELVKCDEEEILKDVRKVVEGKE
jgi:tetratricopeptide (TPR) repeat protein